MFSFHKPKVYRSGSGCCICRAKSSSSRFTDSKRYEDDFVACFKLGEVRSGEICNACVLLVKRWKKLPKGSQRNWNHVVDARAGHGSRPLSKLTKKKKEKEEKVLDSANGFVQNGESSSQNNQVVFIPKNKRARELSPSEFSDDVQMECLSSDSGSPHSSRGTSPDPNLNAALSSKESLTALKCKSLKVRGNSRRSRVQGIRPRKSSAAMNSFLDLNFWKREKTCCGVVFKGEFGELLLDRRYLNPCLCRNNSAAASPEFENASEGDNRIQCFDIDEEYEHAQNLTVDSYHVLSNENYARFSQNARID